MEQHVQVTKNGDDFTYQHSAGDEKQSVTMNEVFKTADLALKGLDRAHAAISFLRDSFEALAVTGKPMHEYEMQGASAVCWALGDMIEAETAGHFQVSQVIEALSSGKVK